MSHYFHDRRDDPSYTPPVNFREAAVDAIRGMEHTLNRFDDPYLNRLTDFLRDGARRFIQLAAAKAESPIERGMLIGLYARRFVNHRWRFGEFDNLDGDCTYRIYPQFKVDPYRVDIGIRLCSGDGALNRWFAVECDGEEWHSKSTQIVNDAGREIFLEDAGFTVLRFTGSEIFRDAIVCATIVEEALDAAYAEWLAR